jgi:uncharacterized protein YkwD
MDSTRFDRLTRRLSSRRTAVTGLLGGGLITALTQVLTGPDAAAAPRTCGRGKKRCGHRCIARARCCTNANCRSRGSGKICRNGTCRCPSRSTNCGRGCCPAGKRCVGQTCWPDAEELAFITLINQYRVTNGRLPLNLQNQLGAAAELHSQDQARNRFSSHTGSDGSTPDVRIARAGYKHFFWAENIFFGGESAAEAFAWWRQSPTHNANMLQVAFVDMGIGRAQSSAGAWYWTTTFAVPLL